MLAKHTPSGPKRQGSAIGNCGKSNCNPLTLIWFTFFFDVFTRIPKPFHPTWSAFALALANRVWEPRNPKDKRTGPCICAATFKPGTTRGTQNVDLIHAAILDLDNKCSVKMDAKALQQLLSGWAFILYETYSSKPNWPRYRLILPFTQPVKPEDWPQVLMGILAKLGLAEPGLVDLPAALDIARLNLLPLTMDGKRPMVIIGQGEWINPERFRMEPKPAPKPQPLSKPQWYRKLAIDFRTLDLARLMADQGFEVKERGIYAGARRWRTECPWHLEHTDQKPALDAFILHAPGSWPVWGCSHEHCQGRGLQDLLQKIGVQS